MATDNYSDQRAASAEAREDLARAQRDTALNVATNEAIRRDVAEDREIDARIAAHQHAAAARELQVQRDMLSSHLADERAAASNNAFGFYLLTGIVVAALLVGGLVYYFWRGPQGDVTINAASPNPPVSTVVTPTAPAPSPVIVTTPPAESKPPVVNVTPPATPAPQIHNNITVPSTPAPEHSDSGKTDSSSDNNGAATNSDSNSNNGSGTGSSGSDSGSTSGQ